MVFFACSRCCATIVNACNVPRVLAAYVACSILVVSIASNPTLRILYIFSCSLCAEKINKIFVWECLSFSSNTGPARTHLQFLIKRGSYHQLRLIELVDASLPPSLFLPLSFSLSYLACFFFTPLPIIPPLLITHALPSPALCIYSLL